MQKICPSILKISEQVLHALSNNKPVVALQSTIISHGMPYPQNRKCALSIEQKIRDQGAVPATVAIFDGKINVGLNEDQIEKLASLGHTGKVRKVSRRDLAFSIANKQSGATTVSGTMIAAHAANIDIFVTGGIGGVHRGFQQTMDVSADLQELARTAVTVVSAGVKSILDIPRTLQYLQTKGVPVITYKSNYFPAFFSESSGIASPFTVSSQLQMAKIIYSHQQLGLESGMLLGVPNPRPAQGKLIQSAIERAIKQSRQQKVSGAKITPFLLKRVVELTEGKSLQSNISLIHNNAEVGGRVASELAKIRAEAKQRATKAFSLHSAKGCNTQKNKNQNKIKDQDQEKSKWLQKPKGRIVAIGGSAIDYQLSPRQGKFQLNKSCIGRTRKSLGGIARNIVDCASKLEIKTTLVTAMGRDSQGNTISEFCNKHNIQLLSILPQKANTQNEQTSSGRYYAIMDHNNNELLGISEMQINELLTFNNVFDCFLKKQAEVPQSDPNRLGPNDIVIVDSNIPDKQLLKIVQFVAEQFGCMIVYESKGQKAKRVVTGNAIPYINLLKMNYHEKLEIAKALEYDTEQIKLDSYLAKNIGHKHPNNEMFKIKAIITKGSESIQLLRGLERQCTSQLLEVPKIQKIEKTTGAGDTFTGTFCSMLLWGKSQTEALLFGQAGSKINIESPVTQSVITQKLSRKYLEQQVIKMKKQK